jgi:diaminopimelate decarboxylase
MTQNTDLVNNFYNVLLDNKFISSRESLMRKFRSLFKDLTFTNARILDIGGGIGITEVDPSNWTVV